MVILLLLFIVSYTSVRDILGFNVLGLLIGVPAEALYDFVLAITGQGS